MVISQRRVTLEEFLRRPDEKPALELIDGRVSRKVSPKGPHSTLQLRLGLLIDGYARPRRLGAAFPEARVSFGGRSPVPDLVFYAWDRIPREPSGRIAEDFTTPPDLIVEILSPGQGIGELRRRCEWYVANGVRVVLLVDPRRETVQLFRAEIPPTLVSGDQQIAFEAILPGFHLAAQQLFDALDFR